MYKIHFGYENSDTLMLPFSSQQIRHNRQMFLNDSANHAIDHSRGEPDVSYANGVL